VGPKKKDGLFFQDWWGAEKGKTGGAPSKIVLGKGRGVEAQIKKSNEERNRKKEVRKSRQGCANSRKREERTLGPDLAEGWPR